MNTKCIECGRIFDDAVFAYYPCPDHPPLGGGSFCKNHDQFDCQFCNPPKAETALPQAKIMNYDPNLTNSGRMAKQRVKLVFGIWNYRMEVETTVGGNGKGLSVIETAVSSVYWKAQEDQDTDYPEFTLKNPEGKELTVQDEDDRDDDTLKDMLIFAEIVSIEPDPEWTTQGLSFGGEGGDV